MATFLTRKGIIFHLDRIIEEADRELVLISPYIKADDETKNLLKDKTRSTTIHVIYGKKELKPDEKSFLDSLGITTSYLKNLHAKCYLNENEALLTSMNLYQFSQEHNDEMGILVSRYDDPELYEAIHKQAMRWKTNSKGIETAKKPGDGFCIRCKATIPSNLEKPYCKRCYKYWTRYKNETYEEKYCHLCGNEHTTTIRKPLCPCCDLFGPVTS